MKGFPTYVFIMGEWGAIKSCSFPPVSLPSTQPNGKSYGTSSWVEYEPSDLIGNLTRNYS